MVTITRFDKSNTIFSGSSLNVGLNPIVRLTYGDGVSRGLIHFDCSKVKCLVEEKEYADVSKLHHVLKMTNCGSVDVVNFNKKLCRLETGGVKERASSFDLIFFLVPMEWDSGRGFDYESLLWSEGNSSLNENGCNWYQARNGYPWDTPGIYSIEKLSLEYEKYSSRAGSDIVIGRQHFDYGNESVELDITEVFNKFISGEIENYGIGMAFSPMLENSHTTIQQYTGFFSPWTHTFFEPYVITTYNEVIEDDRGKFYSGKDVNRLYFYFNVGGYPCNLDKLPICKIEGNEMEVKQSKKGAYYAEVKGLELSEDTMYYDEWSGIEYKGKQLKDVEMDFVVRPESEYFGMGNSFLEEGYRQYVPNVVGINDGERLRQGEVRRITVTARIPYTVNQYQLIDGMEYRVYVKNGNQGEIDIIPYQRIERDYNSNYFVLDTGGFVPHNEYLVDIRIHSGMDIRYHRRVLRFSIVNDETEARV